MFAEGAFFSGHFRYTNALAPSPPPPPTPPPLPPPPPCVTFRRVAGSWALDSHPFFPPRAASGRCVLSAAFPPGQAQLRSRRRRGHSEAAVPRLTASPNGQALAGRPPPPPRTAMTPPSPSSRPKCRMLLLRPCETGAICNGSDVLLTAQNYWRPNTRTRTFTQCPDWLPNGTCQANHTIGTCNESFNGTLCASCAAGRAGDDCEECSEMRPIGELFLFGSFYFAIFTWTTTRAFMQVGRAEGCGGMGAHAGASPPPPHDMSPSVPSHAPMPPHPHTPTPPCPHAPTPPCGVGYVGARGRLSASVPVRGRVSGFPPASALPRALALVLQHSNGAKYHCTGSTAEQTR